MRGLKEAIRALTRVVGKGSRGHIAGFMALAVASTSFTQTSGKEQKGGELLSCDSVVGLSAGGEW